MLRIISLIASATEIVHELGLGENQVGRSHECDYPDRVLKLPVCTRPRIDVAADSAGIDRQVKQAIHQDGLLYEVFPDVLAQLRPTHIVTQVQCKVCAVSLDDVERALSAGLTPRPALVPLEPNSLSDIWKDIRKVASACGVLEQGEALIGNLQARMRPHTCANRPRVACIEWLEPLMAAGNWVPELVELAGGENLFGSPGLHSPWLTWEQVLEAAPDVVVAMPCGFDLRRTREEMHWLTARPGWEQLRSRVYIADGNAYFNRPGPRIAESLAMLVEMLHTEQSRGRGWQRIR